MTNKRFFATLLIGALFGSSVLLAMRGHDLDLLYLELAKCRQDKQQLEEDNKKLVQDLTKAQKDLNRRLRKVVVNVVEAPDEFTKLSVQKWAKLQLQPLQGKDVSLLESQPVLIKSMLENRSIELTNETVKVQVTFVAIGETTTVYLNAIKEAQTLKPFLNQETP